MLGALSLGVGATVGCNDDHDTSAGGKAGGAGTTAGGAGTTAGDAGMGGKARAGEAGSGEAGSGGVGGASQCDCGSDVNQATVPLSCACAAGLCTSFADDLRKYRAPGRFGLPYYVLLGTCAAGSHTLSFAEATEQSGARTYDANGSMVYDHFTGYDGLLPDACGFEAHFSLGSVTIGEDSDQSCSYCLLAGEDPPMEKESGAGGAAGANGAGDPYYPESNTPRCDPSVYE